MGFVITIGPIRLSDQLQEPKIVIMMAQCPLATWDYQCLSFHLKSFLFHFKV